MPRIFTSVGPCGHWIFSWILDLYNVIISWWIKWLLSLFTRSLEKDLLGPKSSSKKEEPHFWGSKFFEKIQYIINPVKPILESFGTLKKKRLHPLSKGYTERSLFRLTYFPDKKGGKWCYIALGNWVI
jgi:hypothetical protein